MSDFGLKDIKQLLKLPNISLVLAGGIPQKPEEHSGKTYVRYIEEMRGEIQKEICLVIVCNRSKGKRGGQNDRFNEEE